MKIKVFSYTLFESGLSIDKEYHIEKEINNFIEGKEVIDIKVVMTDNTRSECVDLVYTVMYREKEVLRETL